MLGTFFQFGFDAVLLERRQVFDEYFAHQVIELVLDADGEQAVGFEGEFFAFVVAGFDGHALGAGDGVVDAGHGKAAFFVGGFAAWSSAHIAGMPLKQILEQSPDGKARMEKIYNNVRNAAYEIIKANGATNFGIGMGLSRIANAILHNQGVVLTVSALLEGELGQTGVYTGVPAVINRQGAVRVINKALDAEEQDKFNRSAELLRSYQQKVDDFIAAQA